MALRLTVQRTAWEAHVHRVAAAVPQLVPVVKGNGYGFGRAILHPIAAALANVVCVGTVHELDGVPATVTPVVLTPSPTPPSHTTAVLTVGSTLDVRALAGWKRSVVVKLQSTMQRYGATPDELPEVMTAARSSGLEIVGHALHLPLAGTDADRLDEIERWLPRIDAGVELWVSHLQPQTFASLTVKHPDRAFRLRLGTALWHGDKSFFHLHADVLAVRQVAAGERVGYQLTEITADGHVVLVDAGSAHGVAALESGASPFHFARTRLPLIEPPHMHTSMLHVPAASSCPSVGDRVDVQRPLITTQVDEIEWV
jgi:alanine racemase